MFATRGLGITEVHILDLVLTNNKLSSLLGMYLFIRMLLILITFLSPSVGTLVAKSNRPKNAQSKVYCYKNVDFIALRETLHYIPWESVISECSFEDCLTRFQDILFSAVMINLYLRLHFAVDQDLLG